MKIAVRLDDITPDMDWGRFWRFKALLDRYQVKPLIGVVPDNQDENLMLEKENREEEFWTVIKQLKEEGWVVAMHGCYHRYSSSRGGLFPLNNFSEFAGLSYEKQKEMLTYGREILSKNGITTDMFMAPAHSYDTNTLRALRDTGFRAMTDGFGNHPYCFQGLIFYPISFRLNRTLHKRTGYSTMVVHTNTVSEQNVKRYEKYFQIPGNEWIPFGEYVKVPPVKRACFGHWREFVLAKGKHLMGKMRQ